MASIILFDGVCNLCNHSVQFILKRDPNGIFKFCSLQSDTAKTLLNQHHVTSEFDSIVLIEDDKYYVKSTAAVRICRKLTGAWKLFSVFWIIPAPLRDLIYDLFAKNRYNWFGKQDSCMMPTQDVKNRFLE